MIAQRPDSIKHLTIGWLVAKTMLSAFLRGQEITSKEVVEKLYQTYGYKTVVSNISSHITTIYKLGGDNITRNKKSTLFHYTGNAKHYRDACDAIGHVNVAIVMYKGYLDIKDPAYMKKPTLAGNMSQNNQKNNTIEKELEEVKKRLAEMTKICEEKQHTLCTREVEIIRLNGLLKARRTLAIDLQPITHTKGTIITTFKDNMLQLKVVIPKEPRLHEIHTKKETKPPRTENEIRNTNYTRSGPPVVEGCTIEEFYAAGWTNKEMVKWPNRFTPFIAAGLLNK